MTRVSATATPMPSAMPHHALRQQRARDAATTRLKRCTHREFLMAPFLAHQEQFATFPQVMSSTTPTAPQENPKALPDIADHVIGERARVRLQL